MSTHLGKIFYLGPQAADYVLVKDFGFKEILGRDGDFLRVPITSTKASSYVRAFSEQ